MFNLSNVRIADVKNEVLAGFVVAVSMIPEAVGFSLVAGLSPIVGLHTAFIIGLVTALFGGKPGMVSGAAGSIVVVLMSLAAQYGMGYVLWATLFAGGIQILIGAFRLGKFIRLVPLPAIHGFVNGLAIVIMLAQLKMIAGQGPLMYGLLPVAALAGVMLVVCYNTFEWSSLRRLRRMPKADALVMIAVTLITIFTDLAVAVISGVIISALVFAWQQARIRVRQRQVTGDVAVYRLDGPLFFGSAAAFAELFEPQGDPQNVVLDFAGTRVMDSSGVEAIDKLTARYLAAGKSIRLRHLSGDCVRLLKRAGPFCSHELDDPQYYVAEEGFAADDRRVSEETFNPRS